MCNDVCKINRKIRIEKLEKRLLELLENDLPAAYGSDNPSAMLQRIRNEERLIASVLSALRLHQSEDRLANNLLIPILSSVSLIIGAIVGHYI
jgi:hypothetical protein